VTELVFAALMLALTLALGLVRAVIGPSTGDRLLALQLLGSGGVGILLLLSAPLGLPALVDVALVLALLAVVMAAAYAAR